MNDDDGHINDNRADMPNEDYSEYESTTLWGTDVDASICMKTFNTFIETFAVGNEFEPYYTKQLEVMHRVENYVLNLNCSHLYHNLLTRTLYGQLKKYPQEVVTIMDKVINDIYIRIYGEREGQPKIQVRTFRLMETSRMRDLDPGNIDQLMSIKVSTSVYILKYAYTYIYVQT